MPDTECSNELNPLRSIRGHVQRTLLQPSLEDLHNIGDLGCAEIPPTVDAMPFLQAPSTTSTRRMLSDEDGVAPVGGLLAIIGGKRRREPPLDEVARVVEDD